MEARLYPSDLGKMASKVSNIACSMLTCLDPSRYWFKQFATEASKGGNLLFHIICSYELRTPTCYFRTSLSSWFLDSLYLRYLLSQFEKNSRSVNPMYNHIEAKITETPIKKRRKIPMWGNLNRILCMKNGWIINTAVNIKHKGASINEDRIISLRTLLVLFI